MDMRGPPSGMPLSPRSSCLAATTYRPAPGRVNTPSPALPPIVSPRAFAVPTAGCTEPVTSLREGDRGGPRPASIASAFALLPPANFTRTSPTLYPLHSMAVKGTQRGRQGWAQGGREGRIFGVIDFTYLVKFTSLRSRLPEYEPFTRLCMSIVRVIRMAAKGGRLSPSSPSGEGLLRPSDLALALVGSVVRRRLVVRSRRLCHGGQATP